MQRRRTPLSFIFLLGIFPALAGEMPLSIHRHAVISQTAAHSMAFAQNLQAVGQSATDRLSNTIETRREAALVAGFAPSYEGLYLAEKRSVGNKSLQDVGAIRFDGCGIVIHGKLSCSGKEYRDAKGTLRSIGKSHPGGLFSFRLARLAPCAHLQTPES